MKTGSKIKKSGFTPRTGSKTERSCSTSRSKVSGRVTKKFGYPSGRVEVRKVLCRVSTLRYMFGIVLLIVGASTLASMKHVPGILAAILITTTIGTTLLNH